MSCSCKNTTITPQIQPITPNPPNPPIPITRSQPTFLDIVNDNSVTPPNNTYKIRVQARVGTNIYKGSGVLTYISDPNTNSVSYSVQTILDGLNAPFIPPLSGLGFLNKYEYQSHDNGTHYIHSFITNKIIITDINTTYHIYADPASCCCCTACCAVDDSNACSSCNICGSILKCCSNDKNPC
jgi:hypothetical protein